MGSEFSRIGHKEWISHLQNDYKGSAHLPGGRFGALPPRPEGRGFPRKLVRTVTLPGLCSATTATLLMWSVSSHRTYFAFAMTLRRSHEHRLKGFAAGNADCGANLSDRQDRQ